MSSLIQAVSSQAKTEVEVAAKANKTIRGSGILGIGKIIGSKERSAILAAVAGAAIGAVSSSPAGLFAAATIYLLTENFRLSIKNSVAYKAADVAIANRHKIQLISQSESNQAKEVPALEEKIQHLEQTNSQLTLRNAMLLESNIHLVRRLQNRALSNFESSDQPGASASAKALESQDESDSKQADGSQEGNIYPSLSSQEEAPVFPPLR